MAVSESHIKQKFAEADKLALAEKANNMERWADAVDSDEYAHATGKFTAGTTAGNERGDGRGADGRFTKGSGGGPQKHRCVWGALADLRVKDGVGSWSYGGYSDGEQIGQNMPSQQLAAFVGLSNGDVVADITRKYLEQAVPEMVGLTRGVAEAFVSYNDSHSSYGKLSQVMRNTAADIRRRLEAEQTVTN